MKIEDVDKRLLQYAIDVQEGKIIANEYIKLATKRYLDWFEREDIYFNEKKVKKVIKFIESLKHFRGELANKQFKLLPFQVWIISNIYGWYYVNEPTKRLINYCYLEEARKSGKTMLSAALSLYALTCDGENDPEVTMIANSSKQAGIAFDMSLKLSKQIDPKNKYFHKYRDSIRFVKNGVLHVSSSEASNLDGMNLSFALLDECHEMKNDALYSVAVSSQGARKNPLLVMITTAGFLLNGFCFNYRSTCIDVLKGLKENDHLFSAIFTIDKGDDWRDETVWQKANPALGEANNIDHLRREFQAATNSPMLEVGFRTKNLNQWVSSSDIWIRSQVLQNALTEVNLSDFKGATAYVGVDLSEVCDLTAVSVCIPQNDIYYFKTFYYLPQSVLENNSNSWLYRDWANQGYLTITPTETVDYNFIIKDLIDIKKIVRIGAVAYDQWNAKKWQQDMNYEGFNLVPFSQTLSSFNYPTKEFQRLILQGKIKLDNNPLTVWCMNNVVLVYDNNSNCKPSKDENQKKIDGVIAMIQALAMPLTNDNYDYSIV